MQVRNCIASRYNVSSFNDGSFPFLQLLRALNGCQEYVAPKLLRFRTSSAEHVPPYVAPVGAPRRAVALGAARIPTSICFIQTPVLQLLDIQGEHSKRARVRSNHDRSCRGFDRAYFTFTFASSLHSAALAVLRFAF